MKIAKNLKFDLSAPDHWVTFGLGILFLLYFFNFVVLGFLVSPNDWDHLTSYYELAWRFWRTSPGLPQFNPYFCGGQTLAGDPQLPLFHPFVFLVPIFGSSFVIKGEMVLQLSLGTFSLWYWLRSLGITSAGSRWGIFLFVGGGAVISKFFVGHETLGFFFLLPSFFYLSHQIESRRSVIRPAYLYILLAVYCGMYKPNFLIQGVPLLALEHLFSSLRKGRYRSLVVLGVAVLSVGVVNAVSYLPAWKYFSEFPRRGFPLILVPPYTLLASLLAPLKTIPYSWYGPGTVGRHEYSIFLGPVAVVLALIGWRYWKRSAKRPALMAMLVGGALLGLGSLTDRYEIFFPHTWLARFWPGYHSVRVPMRAWFGCYLAVVLWSAYGWPRWGKYRSSLRGVVIVLGIFPILISAGINLCKPAVFASAPQWEPRAEYPADVIWQTGGPEHTYQYIRRGQGVIDCMFNVDTYREVPFSPGKSLPTAPGLHFKWKTWNRIAVEGESENSSLPLHFNLNHHPYWRVEGGGLSINSNLGERLTLSASPGFIRAELVYENPYVREGLWISVFGVLLLLGSGLFVFRARVG